MDTILYIIFTIGAIAIIYLYVIEKKNKGDNIDRGSGGSGGILDLSEALRNKKTREEFLKKSSFSTRSPVIKREIKKEELPSQEEQKKTTKIKNSAFIRMSETKKKPVTEVKQEKNEPLDNGKPNLPIKKILAPITVEQGQEAQNVTLLIENLENYTINVVSCNLHFYNGEEDVTNDYVIHSRFNNPNFIDAGEQKEIRLVVDINENATLGNITIIPSVIISWGDNVPETITAATSKLCQWKIEPCGREFIITTEHQQEEKAGEPFSIQIEAYLNNNLDESYSGSHKIFFYLDGMENQTACSIPNYLNIDFEKGKGYTESIFEFFNTLEFYTLVASEEKPGGGKGKSKKISLKPGNLEGFRVDITGQQKNNSVLQGENTITALDKYNNVKSDFKGNVILTCTDGKIKGLPGVGNEISFASFTQGIANLTTLGVKISITNLSEEGRVVKIMAKSLEKIGLSKEITVLPAIDMSPSETQSMIRRLWGERKKKIWIANTDDENAKKLKKNFSKEFEVIIYGIDLNNMQAFTADPPDVLFLDVENEEPNGYEILQKIRKTQHMECLPIFIMGSPKETEQRITQVLKSGSIYLTKPLSVTAIRAMVKDFLENLSIDYGHMPRRDSRITGSEGLVYQIIEKMGEGGMGSIYKARRLRDQKKVIAKYLPSREFKNIKSVMRFIQEAKTVMLFNHENLVKGYDLLMDRNRCFYVMEFIDGKTIDQLIRANGKLSSERSVHIVLQVARALQALKEEHDLIHRDIKPSNVIVTDDGLVKLVDFGIAKLSNHHLTTVGIILGTPYYLSPEQILGKEVDIQSDIYSLGATFYHMVTGEHPFQGPDVYTIIHQRLSRDPKNPREYTPNIPKATARIIMRMLERKPGRRYNSIRLLIRDLESVLKCNNLLD